MYRWERQCLSCKCSVKAGSNCVNIVIIFKHKINLDIPMLLLLHILVCQYVINIEINVIYIVKLWNFFLKRPEYTY